MVGVIKPGSASEKKFLETLRETLDEYFDWVTIYETPVLRWDWSKCVIEINGEEYKCRPLPYTLTGVGEGRGLTAKGVSRELGGKVLLHEYPSNIHELRFIVGEALKNGAEAIVFMYEGGRPWDAAVLSSSIPVLKPDTPPGIPVVVLESNPRRMSGFNGERIRVETEARIHDGVGRTMLAGMSNGDKVKVHVSTHHDGIPDDSEYIGKYIELLRDILTIATRHSNVEVVFVSYTAKEIGDPQLNSYTWSWGSRYLLEILESKNLLDNTLLDINLDFKGDVFEIIDNPIPLLPNPDTVNKGKTHFGFDSLAYLNHGIPSVTISGLSPGNVERDIYKDIGYVIEALLKIVEDPQSMLKRLWSELVKKHDAAPLEYRNSVTRIYESSRFTGVSNAVKALITYTSALASLYVIAGGEFHSCITHAPLYSLLGEYMNRVEYRLGERGRIIVWSLDNIILDAGVRLEPSLINSILKRIESFMLIKIDELLNNILELQVCRRSIQGASDEH
ncbi:aminopeptidase [Desulfurococcus amylolyticus]|uniref:aminopeptidase n=1 Tax=Desulfurococcus amylolyticus TaxID=94694 RepID=UPI0005B211AE|nr:aminopeptidase [Desulfurococcus amylolyticus]